MYGTMTAERKARYTEYVKRNVEASYFPVSKVKMSDEGKFGKYAIVNRETGAKLSEVSGKYTIVKNRDVFEPFINQFGYENVNKFYGYGGGRYGDTKYYYMEIKTGRRFNFGTEEKPDFVEEMICIGNSYNKTKSFTFKLGAFRWVCSNGLHSGEALVNYRKIHVGEIPVTKLVFQALLKFQDNTFDTWKRLKEVPLSVEKRLSLIENLKVFDESDKNGKLIESNIRLNSAIRYTARWKTERNSNVVDNQPNGWGLYNQINYAIDRNISGKSQIDRRVTANKRMEAYLTNEVLLKEVSDNSFADLGKDI